MSEPRCAMSEPRCTMCEPRCAMCERRCAMCEQTKVASGQARSLAGALAGALAWALVWALASTASPALGAADCNENGFDDAEDIATGRSQDCDEDGRPDECPVTTLRFLAPRSYPGAEFSRDLAVTDVGGDGAPDVLVLTDFPQLFLVYEGDGDSGLLPPREFAAGEEPESLTARDFDGDGYVDVVTTGLLAGSGLTYSPGEPGGSFGAPRPVPFDVKAWLVRSGDFDEDGRPDLAVNIDDVDAVSILRGGGDGNFEEIGSWPVRRTPVRIMVADVDGDRHLDVLTGNVRSTDISALAGRGDGTFEPARTIFPGSDAASLALADFDRDGHLDIASAGWNSTHATVLLGRVAWEFDAPVVVTGDHVTYAVAAGDFDGDGAPDLAALGEGGAAVLRGRGDGTFEGAVVAPGVKTRSPTAIDLNGDGLDDLVTTGSSSNDKVNVLLGRVGERLPPDLDGNGVSDACDIAAGSLEDVDGEGIPDSFARMAEPPPDCDGDGVDDATEISSGTATDCDGDGVPDACALGGPRLDLDGALWFPTLGSPLAVVVADLDGDGDTDLATADQNPDGISLLLGRGDGTFEDAVSLPAGERTRDLATADLDGDGLLDLVSASQDDRTVGRLLGRGDGTFEPLEDVEVPASPLALVATDLDGDGIVDVAVCDGGWDPDRGVTLLRGRGDGSFLEPTRIPAAEARATSLLAGDFTADGRIDLLLSSTSGGGTTLLAGDGAGDFDLVASAALGVSPSGVGDLDGDGWPDFTVLHGVSDRWRVTSLLNREGPAFEIGAWTETRGEPGGPLVADLDGDGAADLAVCDVLASRIEVLRGTGDGRFGPPRGYSVGAWPHQVVTADLDGDGTIDLISIDQEANRISWLRGRGGGRFAGGEVLAGGGYPLRPIAFLLADFDGDGRSDLALADDDGERLLVRLGDDEGGIPETPALEVRGVGWPDTAADLDGDGKVDLLTTAHILYRGLGDGTFQDGEEVVLEPSESTWLRSRLVADLDADGRPDIIDVQSRGLDVRLGRDGLRWEAEQDTYGLPEGSNAPADGVLADLDGDGALDVATANEDTEDVTVFLGRGDGRFRAPTSYPVGTGGDEQLRPAAIVAADLDGDGVSDIACLNSQSGDVSILLGEGDGSFGAPTRLEVGELPQDIAAVDLDRDGAVELVCACNLSREVAVLRGRGDGTFEPPLRLAAGTGPERLEVGDVGGDGLPDVAVYSYRWRDNHGSIVLLRNRSTPLARDCNLNGIPDPCDVGSGTSADLNENGVPDECEPDCDANGVPDDLDIARGDAADCNSNGVPDACDLESGESPDVDGSGVPDECEPDCNGNAIPDVQDILSGESQDCNATGVPDECEIASGASLDVDEDGIPDECQSDCNHNDVPDPRDIAEGTSDDCDSDGVPDECQILADLDLDIDQNGVLDSCEPDCNLNGLPDGFEIATALATDCDENGVPDACDIEAGRQEDCDRNGVPDACDIAGGAPDLDGDGIPDRCQGGAQRPGDCTQDGRLDISDAVCVLGHLFLGRPEHLPCGEGAVEDAGNIALLDWQPDGKIDLADAVSCLRHLFQGGAPHALAAETGAGACVRIEGCPDDRGCAR